MQPTDVQVQRTLAALKDAPAPRTSGHVSDEDLAGLLATLPDGLLQGLERGPSLRPERLAEALRRMDTGVPPTADELANRIVGRLVCDRLADVS